MVCIFLCFTFVAPVKKCYKSYENGENNSVPRSTLYRWQARSKKPLSFCENSVEDDQGNNSIKIMKDNCDTDFSFRNYCSITS